MTYTSFSSPRFTSGAADGRVLLRLCFTSCAKDAMYFWRQRRSNLSSPHFIFDSKDVRVFLCRVSLLAPQTGGCFSARLIYFWRQRRDIFLAPTTVEVFFAVFYFWRHRLTSFSLPRFTSGATDGRVFLRPRIVANFRRKKRGIYFSE